MIDAGEVPYPSEARRSHTLPEFLEQFSLLAEDKTPVTLAGRVVAIRRHGALAFVDLADAAAQVQLSISSAEVPAEIFARLETLDSGDFIQTAGTAGTSQRGSKVLIVQEFHLLAKSIRPLPQTWFGLKDTEKRLREREVDLLLNPTARDIVLLRSRVIRWLRDYFTKQGYIEVETPVLQPLPGGAAARPFATHHNALDLPLYLRISAELYLKRLLVGGYEKVFEIGQRFRNEGIDREHNPEFTMLESQWAYADYEDLMDFTEEIMPALVRDLFGTTTVRWGTTDLSFAAPFKRVRYVELVSKRLKVDILRERDPKRYLKILEQEGLEAPKAQTYAKLVDELYKELVRPTLVQPALLFDLPAEMLPLAKPSTKDERVAEALQLVAAGMELCKCYTELNDPVLQRRILEEQQTRVAAGDEEAERLDENYLKAMEYGMPPNAGWSLGVDRLTMLLSGAGSLRETMAFPLVKPKR
jgi:lysyl-tRNA synthetase class 2